VRILLADDDAVSRRLLAAAIIRWGYQPVIATSGPEAWALLQQPEAPAILILDWLMPEMDGPAISQKVRQDPRLASAYIILLTSKSRKEDVVLGLDSGADDFISKPFNNEELRARIRVGIRITQLQVALADRVRKLEEALERERTLIGLLPICAHCKKIRDQQENWEAIETYLSDRVEVQFSHSICPDCTRKWQVEYGLTGTAH
jgi:phosphoserine phosphatase RsbU/P